MNKKQCIIILYYITLDWFALLYYTLTPIYIGTRYRHIRVTCSISCQQIVETNEEWRHYLMEVNSKLYFIGDYGPKLILDESQKLLDGIYGNFASSMVPK